MGLLETDLRYYMDFHNGKIIAKKNNMVINVTKLNPDKTEKENLM